MGLHLHGRPLVRPAVRHHYPDAEWQYLDVARVSTARYSPSSAGRGLAGNVWEGAWENIILLCCMLKGGEAARLFSFSYLWKEKYIP